MAESHCGGSTSGGDGTEGCHIAEHFGEGSLGLYDACAGAACLHAFYLAATLVEVTDYVAHALFGGDNLYLEDRLEEYGACLFGSLLEGLDSAELERELVGVDGVERAVDYSHLEAIEWVSCEHAVLHSGLEALLNRGDEFLGNVTALNLVDKLECSFEFVVGGLNAYDDVGKFTATTGLLLEYLAEFDGLGDGFFVSNLGTTLVALYP